MAVDHLRYDLMVQEALRGVVRRVLGDVSRYGLPGEHHLYVSFRTQHPGVRLSNRLREQYPEEMTIVLQHQFWDLKVGEQGFEVVLSFKNMSEQLSVPFEAVVGFFDPSVQFGLKFEAEDKAPATEAETSKQTPAASTNDSSSKSGTEKKDKAKPGEDPVTTSDPVAPTKVISLDAFRKKP